MIYFRHRKPRKFQKEMIEFIYEEVSSGHHVLVHAPTGIGKTDASIGACLTVAYEKGLDLFFLTPKISQHEMAVRVVEGIVKKYGLRLRGLDIIGKRYMCLHPLLQRVDPEDFYELCKKMVKRELCPFYRAAVGYTIGEQVEAEKKMRELVKKCPKVCMSFQIIEKAKDSGVCAYELASTLARDASFIALDYYHLFSKKVRFALLNKIGKELKKAIIIVDEAHNLPERVRKLMSFTINESMLKSAEKEAKITGNDEFSAKISRLREELKEFCMGVVGAQEECLISREEVLEVFLDNFENLDEAIVMLEDIGLEYLELTDKTRSYSLKLSKFMDAWAQDLEGFARIASLKRRFSIKLKCLDPSPATSQVFSQVYASVLMSATLTPFDMYVDLLGLERERVACKSFPSPFPEENRINIVIRGLTTRFTKRSVENYRLYGRMISRILKESPGNVGIFFPSYEVLNGIKPFIETEKEIFEQKEGMSPEEFAEMIARFKASGNGVLLAVAGGSAAEGIDYPGEEMQTAIIVGVPLAEMNLETQALIDYFEEKFGKGWSYGYIYPGVTRAIQAAGRCIRNEQDRGVAIFMDDRYTWRNYKRAFPRDFSFIVTRDPIPYIRAFWSSTRSQAPGA